MTAPSDRDGPGPAGEDEGQPESLSDETRDEAAGAGGGGSGLETAGETLAEDQDTEGPELELLRFVLADRFPEGPLGPDTVPTDVLIIPTSLAIQELIQHGKRCRRGLKCPHMPNALRRYLRMRPKALEKAHDDVARVLWAEPEHGLVEAVRKVILEKHDEIAQDISDGALLKGTRFRHLLEELGPSGSAILAGVLWASEFEGPNADLLFRTLVALRESEPPPGEPESAGQKEEVRQLKVQLKAARRDTKQAQESDRQAHVTIRQKEQRLKEEREALQEARDEASATAKELDELRARLDDSMTSHGRLEEAGEKAARAVANLRRDLNRLQREVKRLESARGELALRLGSATRDAERLRLELASQPEGKDSLAAFLRAEDGRLQQERLITSGGDKARADAAWTAHRKLEKAFLAAYPEYTQPPPARTKEKVPLELVSLGGAQEVGMSCYLLKLGEHRILIDCGIKPGDAADEHPRIDSLEHLDALVLTHAHTDHIGWVPALVNRFPELDIYCTAATAALLPVMLDDCRRHYVRKLAQLQAQAKYMPNAQVPEEAYEPSDVQLVSQLTVACDLDEPETLPFGGVSLRFFRAGHILGAASVLIEEPSGRRVFVSGDFSSFPQLTLQAASWPEDLGAIDLLILESTYGNKSHGSFAENRKELVDFLRETLVDRGGSVILASFALGRAQELLSLIARAQESGELPAVPVHIDGMINRINPIYQDHGKFELPDSFNEVFGNAERLDIATHDAHLNPSIIVTTSGMFSGGPVVEYARHLLSHAKNRIVFTGYQDEGAPSRALRDVSQAGRGPRVVEVPDESGEMIKIEAAVPAKHISLSAHADQPGLLEYAGRLQPEVIALVHGQPDRQEALRKELLKSHKAQVICGPERLSIP